MSRMARARHSPARVMACPCGCCARVPSGAAPPLEPGKRSAVDGGVAARCATCGSVAALPEAGCFTRLGWTKNKKKDLWCPSCSKDWYGTWASAGTTHGQAWASATTGWASAGSNGGQSWATASGERASASADGEQAWASAGDERTSPAVVAPSAEELVADVWPHYPYSHGRLRVEATLSMVQYGATQIDALKENFTRAINWRPSPRKWTSARLTSARI